MPKVGTGEAVEGCGAVDGPGAGANPVPGIRACTRP